MPRLRPREAGIVLGSLPPGGLNAITDVPGVAEHVGGAHPAATQLPPTQPASLISDEPMLVPREAWQKALEQLGHLRPLAEQLTDASARAAKAETTEGFLREQNRELRTRIEQARTTIAALQAPAPASSAGANPPPGPWWHFW